MRKKIWFFCFLSLGRIFGVFFCSSPSSSFSLGVVATLLYPSCLPLHPRPPNFTHVWPRYLPPLLHLRRLSRSPPTPEIARVAPHNPSFCFPLGTISKGWSTTACFALGAGSFKAPPLPPYLSPPLISLTLTSLFLFARPKKAQHFPVRKVVWLP